VQQLLDRGLVKSVADLYRLDESALLSLEKEVTRKNKAAGFRRDESGASCLAKGRGGSSRRD